MSVVKLKVHKNDKTVGSFDLIDTNRLLRRFGSLLHEEVSEVILVLLYQLRINLQGSPIINVSEIKIKKCTDSIHQPIRL